MSEVPEVPSVHRYLEHAAGFIADMEARLKRNPARLLEQKRAMEAINTAIRMLTPIVAIKLPCPKANLQFGFRRQTEAATKVKQ